MRLKFSNVLTLCIIHATPYQYAPTQNSETGQLHCKTACFTFNHHHYTSLLFDIFDQIYIHSWSIHYATYSFNPFELHLVGFHVLIITDSSSVMDTFCSYGHCCVNDIPLTFHWPPPIRNDSTILIFCLSINYTFRGRMNCYWFLFATIHTLSVFPFYITALLTLDYRFNSHIFTQIYFIIIAVIVFRARIQIDIFLSDYEWNHIHTDISTKPLKLLFIGFTSSFSNHSSIACCTSLIMILTSDCFCEKNITSEDGPRHISLFSFFSHLYWR